jgi:hypothetical protein
MALLKPTQYSFPCTCIKTGQGDSYLDKGMEFDSLQKRHYSLGENYHATEKSEATVMCKEMPINPG